MDRGSPENPKSDQEARDRFPTTRITLLAGLLREGEAGLQEARRHVMAVYASPLAAYFAASRFRDLGDPVEMTAGFFADRLDRDAYLHDWLDWGGPLRAWLITSFRHYCQERIRERKRLRRALLNAPPDAHEEDAERIFHRDAAVSIVRRALQLTRESCVEDGLDLHWEAFVSRRLLGQGIGETASRLGVPAMRVVVMDRTVVSRLRRALRELVAWEGATPEEINRELGELRELVRT